MKLIANSLNDLEQVAASVIDFLKTKEIKFVCLFAEMGSGKTTLVNEIIRQMGVSESGSSPTFSIVNEYFSVNYGTIYHFDFYRLKDEMEAFDIGIEEIFEEDAYIFIEWPEKIENLIPPGFVRIDIKLDQERRTFELEVI